MPPVPVAVDTVHQVAGTVPGWMAPTVILSGIGSFVSLIWNIINYRTSSIKNLLDSKKEQELSPIVSVIKDPLLKNISILEEALKDFDCIELKYYKNTVADKRKRKKNIGVFQKDKWMPAVHGLEGCFERADIRHPPKITKDWASMIDKLDDAYPIFSKIEGDADIQPQEMESFVKSVHLAVNNLTNLVNSEIDNLVNDVMEKYSFKFRYLFSRKKAILRLISGVNSN